MSGDSDSRLLAAPPADQQGWGGVTGQPKRHRRSQPLDTEAEQLAGADELIQFGHWLAIYQLTEGISTESAEALIKLLEES